VENERFREQHVAAGRDTVFNLCCVRDGVGASGGDLSARVCAERELETAILLIRRIEVNASKEHALQELDRWLSMPNAGLVGPVGVAWRLDAFASSRSANASRRQGSVQLLASVLLKATTRTARAPGKSSVANALTASICGNAMILSPGLPSMLAFASSAAKHSTDRARLNQTRPSCSSIACKNHRIVGITKLESSVSPSGQRAVIVFTLVKNFTPSMPCWLVSPKALRFQPPKV